VAAFCFGAFFCTKKIFFLDGCLFFPHVFFRNQTRAV
jgi:hypothetical protein